MSKENLRLAILAAFDAGPSPDDVATAATNVLCAFADVLRGPTAQGVEVDVDTPSLILVELQKANAMLSDIHWRAAHGIVTVGPV